MCTSQSANSVHSIRSTYVSFKALLCDASAHSPQRSHIIYMLTGICILHTQFILNKHRTVSRLDLCEIRTTKPNGQQHAWRACKPLAWCNQDAKARPHDTHYCYWEGNNASPSPAHTARVNSASGKTIIPKHMMCGFLCVCVNSSSA